MNTWITAAGIKVPVHTMSDSHLDNAIKMLCQQRMKDRDHSKLLMLCKERARRKDMLDKYVWCKSPTGKRGHQVRKQGNGILDPMARCGIRPSKGSWTEYPVVSTELDKCMQCQAIIDDETKAAKSPKEKMHEAHVHFVQTIGQPIPLCWIPIDDVKAVVMLLATHKPSSESLKLVRAQFDAAIGHLNEYIHEAEERNTKTEMAVTWTYPGEKQKGK